MSKDKNFDDLCQRFSKGFQYKVLIVDIANCNYFEWLQSLRIHFPFGVHFVFCEMVWTKPEFDYEQFRF